jgi:aquaporin Z
MANTPAQRYLAEFLGTFALLFVGTGAAVFSLSIGVVDPISRFFLIAFAFGVTVAVSVYALGDVSGGHFNPAITLSMALSRRMPMRDVVPYIVAQVAGALVGVLIILGIAYGNSAAWAATQFSGMAAQSYSGAAGSPSTFPLGSVFLMELVATFLFVLVIQFVTRPESSAKNMAPLAIGLTLVVIHLAALPVDGASFNPARSFAPAVLSAGWSGSTWAIQDDWLFWVAPILGGLLASVVESALRPTKSE